MPYTVCRTLAVVTAGATIAGSSVYAQDKKLIDAGEAAYNDYCQTCHGDNLVNMGQSSYDLRRLRSGDRERFATSVMNGKGNMPPWKGVVDDRQLDAIWAYIMSKVPPG